jgi:hypothetical protein
MSVAVGVGRINIALVGDAVPWIPLFLAIRARSEGEIAFIRDRIAVAVIVHELALVRDMIGLAIEADVPVTIRIAGVDVALIGNSASRSSRLLAVRADAKCYVAFIRHVVLVTVAIFELAFIGNPVGLAVLADASVTVRVARIDIAFVGHTVPRLIGLLTVVAGTSRNIAFIRNAVTITIVIRQLAFVRN